MYYTPYVTNVIRRRSKTVSLNVEYLANCQLDVVDIDIILWRASCSIFRRMPTAQLHRSICNHDLK